MDNYFTQVIIQDTVKIVGLYVSVNRQLREPAKYIRISYY